MDVDVTGADPAPARDAEFAEWVRPHLAVLSAVAARAVGADDAPDIVQNALLRAWQRWHTYRADRGTPRAWLLAIVLDQGRRMRTSRRVVPLFAEQPVAPPDVGRLDVESAVRSLPRRQQEVVTLYYLADLSVQDVSAALGIGVGSVKSHLAAARTALRARLEENS